MKEHSVFLLQGSNKGNKRKYLDSSLTLIYKKIGRIISKSSLFACEGWNMDENTPIFYNRVLHIKTLHSPIDILKNITEIENLLGRNPKKKNLLKKYEDREIDIDILFYDRIIIKSFILTIPHPLLHFRRFILEPMCEIAPNKFHPIFHLTILEILGLCIDHCKIKKLKK
ncbi:2-amino-4-hydroxy-6-hydroxymethyldihydropteridine diphosphokinase [Blattabacterium cuenoti]|uniref:2-amino-4-hydroxy-6- hydroxymethyldihydropteridine diphosphokinase n=1 Tax=Blattabacterium cuenoti TaxID=1653831 RepID=UPI00163C71D7|nr:2-amino-4-hydroxy-6-hydroxymethyldihydropteridine diphosphokinase [Blattabacterium cuenoti]